MLAPARRNPSPERWARGHTTVVDRCFAELGRIDVIVSNAGYGLFGAAEELTDAQVDHIIATNLTGSIQLIRSALPHLRAQGGGRIIQSHLWRPGGLPRQLALPRQQVGHRRLRGVGCPGGRPVRHRRDHRGAGGARTEFRYGSAQVAELLPAYGDNPAHSFLKMLDPANGLAPGDPARMAARIIDSVDTEPAPLRMVLGSQALDSTLGVLRKRIADFEAQAELAASTDYPPGE